MNQEHAISVDELDERTRRAVAELQGAIAARYPTTIFELARSPDDAVSLHLLAIADVDGSDEVGDLIVDRVVALQVEEGIPLHVIPLRTPARVQTALAATRSGSSSRPPKAVRLLGEPT